jgi:hypothetical protein
MELKHHVGNLIATLVSAPLGIYGHFRILRIRDRCSWHAFRREISPADPTWESVGKALLQALHDEDDESLAAVPDLGDANQREGRAGLDMDPHAV